MITKSGKHHWMATVIHLDASGHETFRKEGLKFTSSDPDGYFETRRKRYISHYAKDIQHPWVKTKIENLVDLDSEENNVKRTD